MGPLGIKAQGRGERPAQPVTQRTGAIIRYPSAQVGTAWIILIFAEEGQGGGVLNSDGDDPPDQFAGPLEDDNSVVGRPGGQLERVAPGSTFF